MAKTTFSTYYSESLSMNHLHYPKAPSSVMHVHEIEEILFLRKGNAFYHEDGKTYPLSKNCLVISRATKSHRISFEEESEYERYDALFDTNSLPSNIYAQIPSDISIVRFDENALVLDLFKKMDYYYKHFEGNELKNILLHLIEEILYNVVITLRQTKQDNIYSINPLVYKAISYIDKNIHAPISIDMICKELYITKTYLHQIFFKHMQISPRKYIIAQKLLLAQRELRSGKKSTEIYLNCGFSDYSSFYRNYKNYFGHAPSNEINTKIIHEIQS